MLTATFIEPSPQKHDRITSLRANYDRVMTRLEDERRRERSILARRVWSLRRRLRTRMAHLTAQTQRAILLEHTLELEGLRVKVRKDLEEDCLFLCQKVIERLTQGNSEFQVARVLTEVREALTVIPLPSIEEIRASSEELHVTQAALARLGIDMPLIHDPELKGIRIITTHGSVEVDPRKTVNEIFLELRAVLGEEP